MAGGATIARFEEAPYHFYRWRYESPHPTKVVLASVFVSFAGLGAFMNFYIPWNPPCPSLDRSSSS